MKSDVEKQITSIQNITSRYVFFVMLITLVISIVSFFIYRDYLIKQHRQEQIENITKKADSLGNTIRIYRNTLEARSRQRHLVNYILFSEQEKARLWSQSTSPILPHNIGLALFDEDGELLGDANELRVGHQCLADLRKIFKGEEIHQPPVHRNVTGLEHFDIAIPLNESEEIVGVVFASFSLDLIKEELNTITDNGQHLKIITYDDYLITETNRVTGANKPSLNFDIVIPGTKWVMQAHVQEKDMSDLLQRLGVINMSVFLAVTFVMVVFSRRLERVFSYDFAAIHNLLLSVKNNSESQKMDSHLSETKHIFDNIKLISNDIKRYQQQLLNFSNTDTLTGLSNRRAFNSEMPHYLGLAHRGIDVCFMLLDVDSFKRINDTMGHTVGDKVLQALSRCIKENTREIDLAARLGGDEFSIVLAQCPENQVYSWYEKISNDFLNAQKKIEKLNSANKFCTLSAGFVQLKVQGQTVEQLINFADIALYDVKSHGRGDIKQYNDKDIAS